MRLMRAPFDVLSGRRNRRLDFGPYENTVAHGLAIVVALQSASVAAKACWQLPTRLRNVMEHAIIGWLLSSA